MIVHRTALLPLPAAHLFDIIEAAEHYPLFLPWCAGATIVHRDDSVVSADLRVKWGGMNFEMRTRNPKRRPETMAIHLEHGPFRRFEGEWQLTVLAPDACKVAFTLDYDFDSSLMTRVAGPVFKRLADTLVEAFIQRALATPVMAEPVVAAPAGLTAVAVDTPAPSAPPAIDGIPETDATRSAGEADTPPAAEQPPPTAPPPDPRPPEVAPCPPAA